MHESGACKAELFHRNPCPDVGCDFMTSRTLLNCVYIQLIQVFFETWQCACERVRSRTFTGIMTAIAYLNAARLGSLACTSVKVVVALRYTKTRYKAISRRSTVR